MFHTNLVSAGIDVSKETLDTALLLDDGQTLQHTFANNEAGIQKMLKWLSKHKFPGTLPIVIESTGSLHWLACLLLVEQSYSVRLINPIITRKYQAGSIRNTKTDSVDATRLAEIGKLEHSLPCFFDAREQLSAKRYQSLLAKLQKVKQQLAKAHSDALTASDSIGVELNLDCIAACLDQLVDAIKVLKKMIEDQASDLAKDLAKTPGMSLFQATVLCNAVEGRAFKNRDQLTAFFGLDVRQRQSGKWRGRQKLSKRGNPFYRHVLFQLGWSLQRNNPIYREYYERLFREEGKHYYTAILATARKFLRYFFTQLKHQYQHTTTT